MIIYNPPQILLNIGGFKLHTWGLITAIAFIVSFFLILREARKRKLNEDHVYWITILIIIGSIIGARLWWCVEHHNELSSNLDILKFWQGGMSFYAGFILAFLFALIYIITKKINFWKYADVFALFIPLGHAIGRIGCFLNWDDYGIYSSLPWAVKVGNDMPRHPTQLYSVLMNLVIFFILLWINKRKYEKHNKKRGMFGFDGVILLSYLSIYAVFRFLIEFIRDNPRFYGFTVSQYVAIPVLIASVIIFVVRLNKNKRNK